MRIEGSVDVSAMLGSGVYALCFSGEVVYIGKAKWLLQRIYTHRSNYENAKRRRKGQTVVKVIRFSEVKVFPCPESDMDRIESEMIAKFRPKYNDRKVPPLPGPKLKLDLVAMGLAPPPPTPVKIERRV